MKKRVIKDNQTARKALYRYLHKMITNNEVGPGERLVESRIAKETGASRTPVREALQDIEREGLVENIPRLGYVVKRLSEEELEELCRIRAVLEGLAANWAIEQAHARLVRELRKNIAVAEEKISQGDVKTFVTLGAQFHEIIAKMSKSPKLLELTQLLRRHMLRYRIYSVGDAEPALRAIAGHKAMLAAIELGDEKAVCQAIEQHLQESKKDILRYGFARQPKAQD